MKSRKSGNRARLLVPVVVGGLVLVTAHAQAVPDSPVTVAATAKSRVVPYRYWTHGAATQASRELARIWGIGSLSVKSVESGEIIRFTYRVLDPEKAKALRDTKNVPSLIDPGAGVKLPASLREKPGELGQKDAPEAGLVYTIAFSNLDGHVKPGHRVNVIVGQFRAESLLVQ